MLTFLEAARFVIPNYFNSGLSEVDASFWSFVASDIIADFATGIEVTLLVKALWLHQDIQHNNTA